MGKRLITTSIAYVNAAPHIGFALELVQADALKRYYESKGDDVFLLTGTDENGLKIYQTAIDSKSQYQNPKSQINSNDQISNIQKVQDFVDQNSATFLELTKTLNISIDNFIRTSDKVNHYPVAQELWKLVATKGDIEKRKYKGLYCVGCEAFKKDSDLIVGKCPNHNKEPEVLEEENYFFKLSKYSDQIKELIETNRLVIKPDTRRNEILSLLKEGLEDISVSRPKDKLPWGVPVPGDDEHVMYVWFDALTNYLSGSLQSQIVNLKTLRRSPILVGVIGQSDNSNFKIDFQNHPWWNEETHKTHLIGKDIIRFHGAIWVGMLLSAGLPLPNEELVHGFVTSDGQKMSKSLGNVVDPFELVDKYGVDAVRYYLLREIPSGGDGDFSIKRFEERYNSDLANSLGNLVQRVLVLISKNEIKIAPNPNPPSCAGVDKYIEKFQFDKALEEIFQLVGNANVQIDREKPWEFQDKISKCKSQNDKEKIKKDLEKILSSLYRQIETIAASLAPFIPETSQKILEQLKTLKPTPIFPRKDGKV